MGAPSQGKDHGVKRFQARRAGFYKVLSVQRAEKPSVFRKNRLPYSTRIYFTLFCWCLRVFRYSSSLGMNEPSAALFLK